MFISFKMEAKQAHWFEAAYNCVLEYQEGQCVGCAKDYQIVKICPGSRLKDNDLHQYIEFKFDKAAAKTGNLYLEYEQTFNHGESFTRSGMSLAVEQSKYIVFSVPYVGNVQHFVFQAEDIKGFLGQNLRSIRTRAGANGNKLSSWSRGLLLPIRNVPISFKQIERI